MLSSGLKIKNESLIEQHEIEELKKKHLKRRKASKLFKEILFNSMFLWILFVVSYSNKDVNSYNYKKSVENLFLNGFEDVFILLDLIFLFILLKIRQFKITKTNAIWNWMKENLVYQIENQGFYNGLHDPVLKPFAYDYSSMLLTYPIIRQNRIKNSIYIPSNFLK